MRQCLPGSIEYCFELKWTFYVAMKENWKYGGPKGTCWPFQFGEPICAERIGRGKLLEVED